MVAGGRAESDGAVRVDTVNIKLHKNLGLKTVEASGSGGAPISRARPKVQRSLSCGVSTTPIFWEHLFAPHGEKLEV